MQPEFWLQAWESGHRGFHKAQPHPDLTAHAERFEPGTVLVPLCGATLDLGWLAERDWPAVGVELSPVAVAELCERYGLQRAEDRGPFQVYQREGITVLQGDFFELTPAHVGPLSFIWDRAALVALHPSQRYDYVELERELKGDGGLLLNVLDYDRSKLDGPPWAVSEEDVASLWGEGLELLDATTTAAEGRFAEVIDTMTRRLYVG